MMFLNKKQGATPEESRSGLETIAQAHGGAGQKVLAIMVGLGATLVLAVGIGYKYVYPMFSDKPAAPVAAAKPVPEVKPAAELTVPLDVDEPADARESIADFGAAAEESTYEPLPGLASDARPSPPSGRRDRPVGSTRPLPPGMQGETSAAANSTSTGYDPTGSAQPAENPVADRKLDGDLGDFGDRPAAAGGIALAASQRRDVHPDCIGIQGGPNAEAECSRRMPPRQAAAPASEPVSAGSRNPAPVAVPQSGGALASQLGGIQTPNGSVGRVPNPHLTLRKGAGVTCTLDTAISSEQAGFVECVTDYPIYSMDGKVVLAERGTRIVGEYSRDVSPGSKSIFVLWTRAQTPAPHHVTFDLFSPGSDRLGRSGIDGDVDNKYWERYSGPLLFSFLQDVSAAVTSRASAQRSDQGNGVFVLPSTQNTGQNAVAELLKQGADVKRSLYRNQGDTISITVARYVDFSPVYKLRSVKGRN